MRQSEAPCVGIPCYLLADFSKILSHADGWHRGGRHSQQWIYADAPVLAKKVRPQKMKTVKTRDSVRNSANCRCEHHGQHYCERSEQSLTKSERPGQTKTNWWPKMSIRKYLEWCVSHQVSTLFPQNIRFRWGLIAFTSIWAKTRVFIQIFTIILEYKNWAANTCCKSLEHRVDKYACKYFWYCAVCNYGVDRSL